MDVKLTLIEHINLIENRVLLAGIHLNPLGISREPAVDPSDPNRNKLIRSTDTRVLRYLSCSAEGQNVNKSGPKVSRFVQFWMCWKCWQSWKRCGTTADSSRHWTKKAMEDSNWTVVNSWINSFLLIRSLWQSIMAKKRKRDKTNGIGVKIKIPRINYQSLTSCTSILAAHSPTNTSIRHAYSSYSHCHGTSASE